MLPSSSSLIQHCLKMPFTALIWNILALLVLATIKGQATILQPPQDVASSSGDDVIVNCTVSENDMMHWKHKDRLIFNSPKGKVEFQDEHDITGHYDLIVKKADTADGGAYTCEIFYPSESEQRLTGEVVIFDPLSCGVRQVTVIEGEQATLYCHAFYGGGDTLSPTGEFTASEGKMTSTVTKGSNSTVNHVTIESTFVAHAEHDGKEYDCHMTLPNPEYYDNCTTVVSVMYKPKDLAIYPNHRHYYVGEEITCNATANPEPTYEWRNENTTIDGDTLRVTSSMLGLDNVWWCVANNTINGTMMSTELRVNFTVESGVRTTPGPVGAGCHLVANFSSFFLLLLVSVVFKQ